MDAATREAVQAELDRQRQNQVQLEAQLSRVLGNIAELELALEVGA